MRKALILACVLVFAHHSHAQVTVKEAVKNQVGGLSTVSSQQLQADALREKAEMKSRLTELTQRMDKLELEMQSVRREIVTLRKEIDAQSSPAQPRTSPKPLPAVTKADDKSKEKAAEETGKDAVATTQPADEEPADKPAKAVVKKTTFRNMVQMLSGMPKDARPAGIDGWNVFSVQAAKEWLDDNRKGELISMRATVSSVSVERNKSVVDAAISAGEWVVTLQLREGRFFYLGTKNILKLQPSKQSTSFVFKTDEAFARKANRLETGDIVILEGKIKDILVEGSGKQATFTVDVNDYSLSGY